MTQELTDFQIFKENNLHHFDPNTGVIDAKRLNVGGRSYRYYYDIGSKNEDGYERVWCNKKLRMKHRLMYFLCHNTLPEKGSEIDHINKQRDDNRICNLRILSKSDNNRNVQGKHGKQLTNVQVHAICKLLQNTEISDLNLSKQFGRSRATIRDIKTRRRHADIASKYSWEHRGW